MSNLRASAIPVYTAVDTHQDVILEDERATIDTLKQNLAHFQKLTDDVLKIVETFENRLADLEDLMLPLHKQTSSLTRTQRNIESALDYAEKIKTFVETAKIYDSPNAELEIRGDLKEFSAKVELISAAKTFFEENPDYEGSKSAFKNLVAAEKRAMKFCEEEFLNTLSEHSVSQGIEKYAFNLPPDYVLIPEFAIDKLAKLAASMDHCGNRDFVNVYVRKRTDVLQEILSTQQDLVVEDINPDIQINEQKAKMKIKTKKKNKVNKFKVEKYERGSHKFIAYYKMLLKLFQLEKDALSRILDSTSMDDDEIDVRFPILCADPISTFVKQADDVWKKKQKSKLLVLLDILEHCESMIPEFRETLQNGYEKLIELNERFRGASRKAFDERIQSISESPSKEIPTDGGYSALTVQTINFLKNLFDYMNTIEVSFSDLAKSNFEKADASFKSSTATGALAVQTLITLDQNLKQKAENYKNEALSQLFLLNNYHYISSSIKQQSVSQIFGKDIISHFEKLVEQARKSYVSATWSKVLSILSDEVVKDLAAKVKANGSEELSSPLRKLIKSKFANFNEIFDELCEQQRTYSVPDSELKASLRSQNSEIIANKYKQFVAQFGNLNFSNTPGKYIKYREKVFESLLSRFFEEDI